MNSETLQSLLAQLREQTRSTLVPGRSCIPFARLVEALPGDTLTAEQKHHLAGCPICQRTAANVRDAQSYRADTAGNLYDTATGQPCGFEEPLGFPDPAEPLPDVSEQEAAPRTKKRREVAPRRQRHRELALRATDRAGAWSESEELSFATNALPQKRQIAAALYGDADQEFTLTVHYSGTTGTTDCTVLLEVKPCPVKGGCVVSLNIKGHPRTFALEVPPSVRLDPEADVPDSVTARAAEPVPADVFPVHGEILLLDAATLGLRCPRDTMTVSF